MDPISILLAAAGALLMLFMSVGIAALLRQGSKQADKTDQIKDSVGELKVTSGRTDERLTSIEGRVDDLHKRRNDEQSRVFSLAADALIELRNDRRRRAGDE